MSSIFNENNSKSVDGASPHRRLSQMKNHISSKKQQGNKQFIGINENIQHGRISEFHKTVRLNKSRNKNAFNTMTKGILREDDLFLTNMENDLLRKSYQMNEMNQLKAKSIDFSKNFKFTEQKQKNKLNKNKHFKIINVNSGTNTESVTRTNV